MRTSLLRHRRTWWHVIGAMLAVAAATLCAAAPGAADVAPNPIVPTQGEQNLLDVVNGLSGKGVQTALDNFPVPFVVVAQAGGGAPVVLNMKAGSPKRVDADSSKTTGLGGDDISVEVNTVLTPAPHLTLTVNRLGSAPFAQNLKVEVAFPFDAFDNEDASLPAPPNLFIGYQTTAAGGAPGGYAPLSETISFTPNVVAGTKHTFQLSMQTGGADNPLRFLVGHFDGTNVTGLLNADAIGALVEPVPATIAVGLSVNESALSPGPGGTLGFLDLSWDASAPAKVSFDYLEDESAPSTTPIPDYNSTLTFDQMPTSEDVSLGLDEAAGTLTITNTASAPIGAVTLLMQRNDGLTITATAGDVPTHVALTVGLAGTATLDVNANTLDLSLVVQEDGGFLHTSSFLGYDVGYLSLGLKNVPDLTAGYIQPGDKLGVKATNPGESIGAIELVIADSAANLQLPPTWSDTSRDEFSLVDDGSHGTAAARILHLSEATLRLHPSPTGETYDLVTGAPAPLSAYIRTTPASHLIPGHDVLADCHVEDVPQGKLDFNVDLPDQFSYTTDPPQSIASVGCTGHVDTLQFDVSAADLPPVFAFDFDPAGHLTVKAEDGTGPNTAFVGNFTVRLDDGTGPGLPSTSGLLGIPIRDARARVDHIPSFHATWATGGTGTAIDYHNDSTTNFLGGAQVDVATDVGLAPLPAPGASAHDYGRFVDHGGGATKELAAGAFGINRFQYTSNDATHAVGVHYAADAAHQLDLHLDSRFGGVFFPADDITGDVTVDKVPQSFDLTTNLATHFDYTASAAVSALTLSGTLDTTNDGDSGNSVHVEAAVHGLPQSASLTLDPSASGSLTFATASPIDSIGLDVTGGEGIFGSPIKQVHVAIDHIPANWTASWDGTGASVTAVGDHVDQISAIVSTDLPAGNDAMRAPFTSAGGTVGYTTWLRTIDDRWASTGTNFPQRETDIMSRLDDIYGSSSSLGSTEDRILFREDAGGNFQYLELQLTNLQGGSFHSSPGHLDASLTDPVTGDHPVYVGFGEQNGNFLTLDLANLPDTVSFDASTGNPGHMHFDTNEPAGRVQAYEGPLPGVTGNQAATKFIVVSLPSSMHLDWSFGGSGTATFTASSPVEIRFLDQNGSTRVVSVVDFQNLSLGYGVTSGSTSSGECNPLPPFIPCNEYVQVVDASASFNATPGVSGMLLVDPFESSPQTANGIAPSGGGEYRPEVSFLLKNLTSISADAGIQVCYLPLGIPPCLVGAPLPFAGLSVTADAANLDFWDNGGGPLGILGDPDYVGNNPWKLYPFLYGDSSRIDPFS